MRIRRVIRWTGRVVGVGLIVWLWWGAYLRLTTPPAISLAQLDAILYPPPVYEPNDVTAEVARIADAFWNLPPQVPPSPPAGYTWNWGDRQPLTGPRNVDWLDTLCGSWTPVERPNLEMAVRLLESDAVQADLRELRSLRSRPFVIDISRRGDLPKWVSLDRAWGFGRAGIGHVLLADARRLNAARDPRGAWEDLQTALWIVHRFPATAGDTTVRVRRYVLREVCALIRECPPPPDVCADMRTTLATLPTPEQLRLAEWKIERASTQAAVDALYTRSPGGHGWPVLSLAPAVLAVWEHHNLAHAEADCRSRWWNLAAPLYADRRDVTARLTRFIDTVDKLPPTAPGGALRRVYFEVSPCDAPLLTEGSWHAGFAYSHAAQDAGVCAAHVVLALAELHARTGAYPLDERTLDAALDGDPAARAALRSQLFTYERTTNGDFRLLERGEPVAEQPSNELSTRLTELRAEPQLVPPSGQTTQRSVP